MIRDQLARLDETDPVLHRGTAREVADQVAGWPLGRCWCCGGALSRPDHVGCRSCPFGCPYFELGAVPDVGVKAALS